MKIIILKVKYLYMFFVITIGILMMIYITNIKAIKEIKTSAAPITNKIIVLDAGHGLPDNGTTGISGLTEQQVNLQVTLKLQEMIEQSGGKVILTRADDNGIYEVDKESIRAKKISDMNNRVYIANNSQADIYVSIHMNYYKDSYYSGWQTFYQSSSKKSKLLANNIQQALNENIEVKKRNPMSLKGVYIMDKIQIPTVIVECGFLSNEKEEEKLKTETYQNTLAWGIFVGIQRYFMEE